MMAAIDQRGEVEVEVLPAHARASDQGAILAAVLIPGINLAIWQRRDLVVVPDVETLDAVHDLALTATTEELRAATQVALFEANYPPAFIDALADDIAMLGGKLSALLDCSTLAVRLEVIETDACRKFHTDYVSLRLISTYVGGATQWLDDQDAMALRDGAALSSLNVRSLATGDVALFKGRDWSALQAISHRSPPIASAGGRRLVLVIDPAADAPIALR
jgi:hypothetical protein